MTKLITIDYEEYEDLKRYKELFEENWEVETAPNHASRTFKKRIRCKKLFDFLADDTTDEIWLVRQNKDPREGETW